MSTISVLSTSEDMIVFRQQASGSMCFVVWTLSSENEESKLQSISSD